MDHGEIKQLCPIVGFAVESPVSGDGIPSGSVERWPVVGLALCADGTVQMLTSDSLGEIDMMDGGDELVRDDKPLFQVIPAAPKSVAP